MKTRVPATPVIEGPSAAYSLPKAPCIGVGRTQVDQCSDANYKINGVSCHNGICVYGVKLLSLHRVRSNEFFRHNK